MFRVHGSVACALFVGASLVLAQGRPARGLPAPKELGFAERILAVWLEQPSLLGKGSEEVGLEVQAGALLPSLAEGLQAPEVGSGTSEFVRVELPSGALEVRKLSFATPTAAQAWVGYGVALEQPTLIEVRAAEVLLVQGPALARATPKAVSKLRAAGWARPTQGLAPATPWSLVVASAGEGELAFVDRGADVVLGPLAVTRDTAREKTAELSADPAWQLRWLDGEARETASLLLGDSSKRVELYATSGRGSFVMAGSWERVEGLKGFLRQLLQRRLPAAPEGVEPERWSAWHRKAKLVATSPHTTPVLLAACARASAATAASGAAEEGPTQGGLTEGVEQGTPKKQ